MITDEKVCYTTEALRHAQCAYFVSIVVVQWADLMICKTRKLSIAQQGMRNWKMNFGILFETALAVFLCYVPPLQIGLGTRDLVILHLGCPAMPFFTVIFFYDETRKYIMRWHRAKYHSKPGWVERFTYY
jgi:sodium/potassium-transporting ATPase subunit alpha